MYSKKSHIHFMGIGGIGMSGIAKILKHQGYTISGCDLDLKQPSVKELITMGCMICPGHDTDLCNDPSIDILVYSSAIRAHNPEIVKAQHRGIPTIARALMLAELMRTKYGIAIAGSHGKTTTTSMISHILMEAALNPTVIVGGHVKSLNTNAHFGNGDFLVAEADESDRSLVHLHATIAVITNIDLEHLETYHDINDIKQTFVAFLNNLPFYGTAIVCIDDPHVRSILPLAHLKTIKYGIVEHINQHDADIYASDITLNAENSTFTVFHKNSPIPLGTILLNMPGRHNILNALGAIATAYTLTISFEIICRALAQFQGVKRRFSFHGLCNGADVFDDYGHHPNEIIQTLIVARKRAHGALHVLFQPHRYTRTEKLWHQFIEAFLRSSIDSLVITDIYSASEHPIAHITSTRLVQEIKQHNPSFSVHYIPCDDGNERLVHYIQKTAQPNDLILLLGAGNINKIADKIITENCHHVPQQQYILDTH